MLFRWGQFSRLAPQAALLLGPAGADHASQALLHGLGEGWRHLSTQPAAPSLKAATRALLKKVHPDLFHHHPQEKAGAAACGFQASGGTASFSHAAALSGRRQHSASVQRHNYLEPQEQPALVQPALLICSTLLSPAAATGGQRAELQAAAGVPGGRQDGGRHRPHRRSALPFSVLHFSRR